MIRWLLICCIALIAMGGEIEQKLVLTGDADFQKAEVKLYQAKILFLENKQLQMLQKTYHITITIEQVLHYYLIVASPIKSKFLKEKLSIYMMSHYQNSLFINTKSTLLTPHISKLYDTHKSSDHGYTVAVFRNLLNKIGIGVEWIAILLLSVIGLLLSLYRRRTIVRLQDDQHKIAKKEESINKEIQSLEGIE